ncbi:hypothetical protein HN51_070518, partial [Arachis hypogaea]
YWYKKGEKASGWVVEFEERDLDTDRAGGIVETAGLGTERGEAGKLAGDGGGEAEEAPRCCVVVKQGRLHVAVPW